MPGIKTQKVCQTRSASAAPISRLGDFQAGRFPGWAISRLGDFRVGRFPGWAISGLGRRLVEGGFVNDSGMSFRPKFRPCETTT